MRMNSSVLSILFVQYLVRKSIIGWIKNFRLSLFLLTIVLIFGNKAGYSQAPSMYAVYPATPTTTCQAEKGEINLISAYLTNILRLVTIESNGLESMIYSPGPDTIDPVITCPIDPPPSPNSFGFCSAFVTIDSATATDDCPGVVITNDYNGNGPDASDTYPVGTTTVTFTATDTAGNFSTCTIDVTVIDLESPSIGCPLPEVDGTDPGQCYNTSVDIGTPLFVGDNCGILTVFNNAPDTFFIGITFVEWIAIDINFNSAICTQTVIIIDDEGPTITCPADVTACTSDEVTLGNASAMDNCGAVDTIYNDAPATFPTGTTIVTWTAEDIDGNISTCTQMVLVDDTPPAITCPADVVACTSGGVILGTPTVSDNCGVDTVYNNAPISYPIGNTTVTWTVVDSAGNMATCDQMVLVDDMPPAITCPADVVACTSSGVNLGTPTVSDNCGVDTMYNNAPVSYPIGNTTVTWTVVDSAGNMATCNQMVLVDDTPPSITCPADVVACHSDSVSLGNPITSDNCGISTLSNNAPANYPLGPSTVTWTVIDSAGNIATCNQLVTITDTAPPMVTCPVVGIINTDPTMCSAIVNGLTPTVTDCNDFSVTYAISGATVDAGIGDASGTEFFHGQSLLTYYATDTLGNIDSCSVIVDVQDALPPVITCPGNIVILVPVGTVDSVVNNIGATAVDNCALAGITYQTTGVLTVSGTGDISGMAFPSGITTITYTASDTTGNIDSCTFLVNIFEEVPNLMDCPGNQVQSNDPDSCNAIVTGIEPIILIDPLLINSITYTLSGATTGSGLNDASGISFNIGTTTVEYILTDIANNMDTCSFEVTVVDNEPPIVTGCLPNLTINSNQNTCYATFSWPEPIFTDLCSNPVIDSSTHSPGDTFQIGTTTIIYLAIDAAGNVATCSFDLTVIDNQAPDPLCPPDTLVISNDNDCGKIVTWPTPDALDNCDNSVVMTSDIPPGSFFPVGSTTVTYTAMDNSGNTDTCSFIVSVLDISPPEFTCHENIVVGIDGSIISDDSGAINSITPNSGCDSIMIDYFAPPVEDNCTIDSFGITSGLSPGAIFPVGTTTITYLAVDVSGNLDTCSFDIIVIPLPAINVTINPSDTVCEGQNITLTTDVSTTGATFSWENISASWSDTVPEPMISNISLADTGTYSVTVTFPSGCTSVGSTVLAVAEACDVTITSNAPLCSRQDLELMADIDTSCNVVSYSWDGPGFSSNMQNPVIPDATPANSGIYTLSVEFEGGCIITRSIAVDIFLISPPVVNSSCAQDICLGTSCILSGTQYNPTPDAYNWEALPPTGAGLPLDTDNNEIVVTPTLAGTYIYNYSVDINGCFSPIGSTVLIVHDSPIAVNDNFDIDFESETIIEVIANDTFSMNIGFDLNVISGPSHGELVYNDDGTFSYTPDVGFIGSDQFVYEICYDCENDLCDNAVVTLEVIDNGECVIPTLITPNTDGVNDELFINCLESGLFPNNELVIFNQWGHEVFRAAPYQNNWFGTYEGKDLPDGTYFFVFKFDTNDSEIEKGALTIFR